MKVLFLVQKEQRIILDRFYDAIDAHCDMDIRWLTSAEQDNLKKYFKQQVNVADYDRIMLFLRFKKEIRQVSFIKTIPNLVFLEHDAYQNYIDCKYKGKFSKHYKQLIWARILTSGAVVTKRLQAEGYDAVFVPKGYDQQLLYNMNLERDIELGFVGSIKSATYSQRKEFLEQLATQENMLLTRTKSGDEYLQTLNRIRFFVSADIGMGEYMIKNFEAMACGCVLFAYDQGHEENKALGFEDMHNIVLYKDIESLKNKLAVLRADADFAAEIAKNGQKLAEDKYTFAQQGKAVVDALRAPLRKKVELSYPQKICRLLGFKYL
ncbi:MAG: glycosyltransferase [Pseudomonas sp.]|jgi:spore maturation protein CgeB|nr:glycosyltransferase [Pseudomonas sp.]MDD2224395.1 glycosyltransferase [Pseudomonas sp.]MDY0415124.1 glycosyltransferase [Pseudomonas sp.]NLO54946.1 glycosyltransferase family 1 protein [Gammaproteobacteria bacterium]